VNARSIHVRLILWYTVLIVFACIGFGAFAYYSLRDHLYLEMQRTLARRVEHIRDDILPRFTASGEQNLGRQIEQVYSPEDSNRFVRITRGGGSVVYVSGTPSDRSFDPLSVPASNGIVFAADGDAMKSIRANNLLIAAAGAVAGGARYTIEMGAPVSEIDGVLHRLVLTLLFGMPVMAVIAIAGGSFLVRRSLGPVEYLRATAEKITFGNMSQRLPVATTGDAIENLSLTLNQMLERLEHAYHQASRFSADASHELRTPLTIMRSELESINSAVRASPSLVALQDRIGSVLEETERLSGIVASLFALARLDAGEAKREHKTLDLARVVHSTVEQMRLLAEEKLLSVSVDAPQAVFVAGDETRLKQVVVNLLDNAIKYTMAGGTITLAVRSEDARAILTVRDNGIGIPAEDLSHVFERFYRTDRARDHSTGGAGLGLSIVHAICQAHGGLLRVESALEVGTTVTMELNLAPEGGGRA
jgi:heavy metal sensor kinase